MLWSCNSIYISAQSTLELIKYNFSRQLVLDGVIRLQHQRRDVLVADILTKDLGRKVHKRHRDVLCGKVPISIVSVALPDSQKVYMRRHNEELERRIKRDKLKAQFEEARNSEVSGVSTVQALLGVLKVLAG